MGYQVYLFLDSLLGNQEIFRLDFMSVTHSMTRVQSGHQGQRD